MPINPEFQRELIQVAQLRLSQRSSEAPLTRDEISSTVERLLAAFPEWKDAVSKDGVVAQLNVIFSTFIGDESVLRARDGHVPWLKDADVRWRFWDRYRTYMIRNQTSQPAINSMNRVTDRILDLLGNPASARSFDRRGMVVGDVQSGKTGNYTGLICKATDAGYKVIVVLTGLNNNLRSQTQIRLDEGFIGKVSVPIGEDTSRVVGAGQIDPSAIVDWATNRTEKGDFNWKAMSQFGVHPGGRPLLLVVKKNASVLKGVLEWIRLTANAVENGRAKFSGMPVLVVDDEADNASVDTRKGALVDGIPASDHKPSTINGMIRQILSSFDQVSYVGYTATPFANIFIHPDAETGKELHDLFPRDFIVNMPTPDNYIGASRIFGYDRDEDAGLDEGAIGLPKLVVPITDFAKTDSRREVSGWMPPAHKVGHIPLIENEDGIPESLLSAIRSFALAVAARRVRGQGSEHNSMLVHVTRYQAVQKRVVLQIQEALDTIANSVRYGGKEGMRPLYEQWKSDFEPVTSTLALPDCAPVAWSEVREALRATINSITIREINGSSADVLDYDANKGRGLNVIAVGGDKLARGLTLEGLSITYFLRGSSMYDTLLQMGRWFGYRHGYLDLCRLYTSQDHIDWYGHIAQANDELRREFDRMEAVGADPIQFGLRVRSHPSLTVTSRAKMRHGTELKVSFAGDVSETSVFSTSPRTLSQNFSAAGNFIDRLRGSSKYARDPEQVRSQSRISRWAGSHLWQDVGASDVIDFLDSFSTHEDAARANSSVLAKYIRQQLLRGELTNWNVLLVGGDGEEAISVGGVSVNAVIRQPKGGWLSGSDYPRVIKPAEKFVIRRLLSPRDEAVDLDAAAFDAAMAETVATPPKRQRKTDDPPAFPSGVFLRKRRSPTHGLLLLYPLARLAPLKRPDGSEFNHLFLPEEPNPIGLGISFPASENAASVTYVVNSIYDTTDDDGDA
ncbi:hypothetical protein sos41_13900 [Alphaproteobacteria bacterium SO-S41]|nr:hypothetical protein sos41_13900 [Alphaproteobacteria bacterium SO-S41]